MANNNQSREKKHLLVMVNSANSYLDRRKSIRNSWMRYLTSNDTNILTEEQKNRLVVTDHRGMRINSLHLLRLCELIENIDQQ